MDRLRGLCPNTAYSLVCAGPCRLLVTAHLSTRYASTEMGVIAGILFRHFPALRTVTRTRISRVRRVIGPYKLFEAGTGDVDRLSGVLVSRCSNILPSSVRRLAGLPKVNEGATGLVVNSVCRRPTIITSARYVEVAGGLNLDHSGSPRGIRGRLHRVLPPSGSGSFYREVMVFNESIYVTEQPGYGSYPLGSIYRGGR